MKLKNGKTIKPEDVEADMMKELDKVLDAGTYSCQEERDYVEEYMREMTRRAAYLVVQSGGMQ